MSKTVAVNQHLLPGLSDICVFRAFETQVTHYINPKLLAEVSENLGEAMVGLTMCVCSPLSQCDVAVLTYDMISQPDIKGGLLASRGW